MRIDELTIQNFKCFENETFRFNPHFNVIIGKNGSGKSSLLDALAVAASSFIYFFDKTQLRTIENADRRIAYVDSQPKQQPPNIISAIFDLYGKKIDWTSFALNMEMSGIAEEKLAQSRKASGVAFPLIAYYTTKRLWSQKKEIKYFKQEEGVFLAYKDCLNGKITAEIFLSWFKTFEDEVKKFNQPLDKILFQLMKDTITSVAPEWTDMEYSFRDEDMIGIFKDERGGINKLPFSSLSDGYRNMIAMVADMVYRCIQLNPGLKERAVADTEGVVLIDEIDLHLHPEWQRRVVNDLKRVFPKIQFFATTHSPFIIQETEDGELIKLCKGKVASTKSAEDYSIEDIAEYIQGVHDPAWSMKKVEMYNTAKKYFALLNELQPGKANGEIEKIREELNLLGRPYSDNVAYTAFLEQKRFLAEQSLRQ